MKIALFTLLCLAAVSAFGATAYDALGAIGKQRGEKTLDQVTEVRGINGAPQPKEWLVIMADREARGGVREFGVQGARIANERTPAGRVAGSLMNMNQLNLDSDGAYTIAEREAKKAGFEYDYADYVLRAGTRGGAPIWELRLVDQQSGDTGTIVIAADNGTLLSADGLTKSNRPGGPEPRPPVAREDRRQPENGERGDGLQRTGDKLNRFFDRVGRHMDRRGRQIGDTFHNLFTGDNRRTAGPHSNQEEEEPRSSRAEPAPQKPRSNRDDRGTDYYRPRD
jgi:hypothetical protein